MKKSWVLVLIVILGCNEYKPQIHIKKQTIKKFAAFKFNPPSPEIALYLFVKSSDGSNVMTNIIALLSVYNQDYSKSYISIETFLTDVFYEKIILDHQILIKKGGLAFQIDESVKNDYENLTLINFRNRYCDKSKYIKNHFYIRRNFKEFRIKQSIMYFFFINNYLTLSDDYSGSYIVVSD